MNSTVMLPWPDHFEVFGDALRDVHVVVYEGGEAPSDDDLARVGLYVLPYLGGPGPLELLGRMPALRAVQTLSAGVDDVWPYLPDGATLHNAAGVHDASTAELAVGLMLASLRGIDDFARAMATGTWQQGHRPALADKRVLLIGYGRIGGAIERRLAGFEVAVTKVARTARDDVHAIDELPDLLPDTDVVVLVTPLTDATRGLVDAAFLARLPDGALLVNVARGAVVDTGALVAEVSSGRLRAALDVTDPEPLPADHPLWRTPGVLISPHVGGDSSAFEPRARALIRAQLARWSAGEPLANRMHR